MLDFYIVVNTVFISKKQFKSKKNMIKGDQMCVFEKTIYWKIMLDSLKYK